MFLIIGHEKRHNKGKREYCIEISVHYSVYHGCLLLLLYMEEIRMSTMFLAIFLMGTLDLPKLIYLKTFSYC